MSVPVKELLSLFKANKLKKLKQLFKNSSLEDVEALIRNVDWNHNSETGFLILKAAFSGKEF